MWDLQLGFWELVYHEHAHIPIHMDHGKLFLRSGGGVAPGELTKGKTQKSTCSLWPWPLRKSEGTGAGRSRP